MDPSEGNVNAVLGLLKQCRIKNRKLVEFPGIILPSFQPILQALQKMSRLRELSFAESIVPEPDHGELKPPFYAVQPGFRFNFQDVMVNDANLYYRPGQDLELDAFKSHTVANLIPLRLTHSSRVHRERERALLGLRLSKYCFG